MQVKLELGHTVPVLVFAEGEKTSVQGKNQQQTQLTYDARSGARDCH